MFIKPKKLKIFMEDKQQIINDNGIWAVQHTLNKVSKNIVHTEKNADEISALIGNHIQISKRERNKIGGGYIHFFGDFIIELRKGLENLINGGDKVNLLLDCDAKNEFYAGEGEILGTYHFVDGLSGVRQELRTPTSYEVALLNRLSNAKRKN